MRRIVILVLLLALGAVGPSPGGAGSPAQAAPSAVVPTAVAPSSLTMTASLSRERTSVIARGRLLPAQAGRPVLLQRYLAGAWRTTSSSRTLADGTYTVAFLGAPAGTHVVRVVAPATATATLAKTPYARVVVPAVTKYLAAMRATAGTALRVGTVRVVGTSYAATAYGCAWLGESCSTTYALGRQWRTFRVTLGLVGAAVAPMAVQIRTDGRTRLRTFVMPGKLVPVRLDVRGVRSLRIDIALGSHYYVNHIDDVALVRAALRNDTAGDSPSTAGTTFLSDLVPTVLRTPGADMPEPLDSLSYPGAPGYPRGAPFSAAVRATARFGSVVWDRSDAYEPVLGRLDYAIPSGAARFTARVGSWGECGNNTFTVRVLADGVLLATVGPLVDLQIADVSVIVAGRGTLTIETVRQHTASYGCRELLADGRLVS